MAGETRGRTIPRVAWWCDLATSMANASGKTREQIADEIHALTGYRTDNTGIVRCLSGKVLTLELAQHLSMLFRIPPPVIIPVDEEEAWALVGRREVAKIHRQVSVLKARTEAGSGERHRVAIPSTDGAMGREPKRKRGRVDGDR